MRIINILVTGSLCAGIVACTTDPPELSGELYLDLPAVPYQYNAIFGIGDTIPGSNAVPTLGRVLFYDRAMSVNNTISCASCHKQANAFADNVAFSRGFGNKRTLRNSMPIQNLGGTRFFFETASSSFFPNMPNPNAGTLFWDGREKLLKDMVLRPIVNHVEMGITDMDALAEKLEQLPYYQSLFIDAFGDSDITKDHIATALNSFVVNIESRQTRFDKSFFSPFSSEQPPEHAKSNVLTKQEMLGAQLFITKYDCNSCHQTQSPSGYLSPVAGVFANIGLDEEYTDNGLSMVTKSSGDAGKFKIPSLRNVALTAPYMHDGRFETLEDVIDHYSESIETHPNLDRRLRGPDGKARQMNISPAEKTAIIAFLHTLTDQEMISDVRLSDPFKFRAK